MAFSSVTGSTHRVNAAGCGKHKWRSHLKTTSGLIHHAVFVHGHLKGGIGAGASLAAVAQIGVVGGPAGLALLVGLSAGILANRATEKVSVVQIGQFVAERAAVAATETKRLAARYVRTAEASSGNGLGSDFDGLKSQVIKILEYKKLTRHYTRGVERVFLGSSQGMGDVRQRQTKGLVDELIFGHGRRRNRLCQLERASGPWAHSAYLKQPMRWSLTSPVACMWA